MKLGWYVYLRTPGGAKVPVVGFWRKRTALRWMAANQSACNGALEVHRWSWALTQRIGSRGGIAR